MTGDAALVTVGITCFNAEDTIARAIASALRQTWSNLEIIVVDDCSTDRSVKMAEEAIAGQANARIIRRTRNGGPAAARNTILEGAKGEFVAFFDDDDESQPERVALQVRHLEEYERRTFAKLVVCCASGVRRYANGYELELPAIGSRGPAPHGPEFADYLLYFHRRRDWYYGIAVPSCALLARRSTLNYAGGYDANLRRVEDNDLGIRLALAGAHFTGVARRLYVQYATTGEDKSPERNLEAEQAIARKFRHYLRQKGRYHYALHWPKLRYWHFKRRYDLLLFEFLGIFARNPMAAASHLLSTGPRRLIHELRMGRRRAA